MAVVVHAFYPSTWETEADGILRVLGQPRLWTEIDPFSEKQLEKEAEKNIANIQRN